MSTSAQNCIDVILNIFYKPWADFNGFCRIVLAGFKLLISVVISYCSSCWLLTLFSSFSRGGNDALIHMPRVTFSKENFVKICIFRKANYGQSAGRIYNQRLESARSLLAAGKNEKTSVAVEWQAFQAFCYDQFTSPTPAGRNCRVSWRRA